MFILHTVATLQYVYILSRYMSVLCMGVSTKYELTRDIYNFLLVKVLNPFFPKLDKSVNLSIVKMYDLKYSCWLVQLYAHSLLKYKTITSID